MENIQKLSYTALAAINGIGSASLMRLSSTLIKHKVGWGEFWVLSAQELLKMSLNENQINSMQKFKKEHTIYSYYEYLQLRGIRSLCVDDIEYPSLLKQCSHYPSILFAKGSVKDWRSKVGVAVVGTRNITSYGRLVTNKLVTELVGLGTGIVSGCMYGVDMVAHQTAVKRSGETIGVLGYGFNHFYPVTQQSLMEELLSQGLTFYSPFAPHIPPKKGQFPARNRIVAGMSKAVVIAEAAENSGSHITAGYAADEGRVVCAVPGPITNPYSEGTKSLINQGAVLVSSGHEVLLECGAYQGSDFQKFSTITEYNTSDPVLKLLYQGPLTTTELAEQLALPHSSILLQLTTLELSRKVKKEGVRWFFQAE